jgi:predicted RNA-binding Zn-ribbon protein involved in translation (DUF1610 family)
VGESVAVVNFEDYSMSREVLSKQVNLIQDVMKNVMKKGEHYGIIPGCDKPSLLKPGAEKLSLTFRLSPTYVIKQSELPGMHREYNVVCTLTHIPTGKVLGEGVGSCSTMESKFRFRKVERVCPKCGKEAIIKGKKEYGGGFVCFKKKGGCGEKFKEDDPQILSQKEGKAEYENPADYYNTVLKMAKKRAHVDAILTAVGASDIFTQDVEENAPIEAEPVTEAQPQEEPDIPCPPVPEEKEEPKIQMMITNLVAVDKGKVWWKVKQGYNNLPLYIAKKEIGELAESLCRENKQVRISYAFEIKEFKDGPKEMAFIKELSEEK